MLFTRKLLTCAPVLQAQEAELKKAESAHAAALQGAQLRFKAEIQRRLAEQADSHSAELQAVESRLQAQRDIRAAEGKSLQATIKVESVLTCCLLSSEYFV